MTSAESHAYRIYMSSPGAQRRMLETLHKSLYDDRWLEADILAFRSENPDNVDHLTLEERKICYRQYVQEILNACSFLEINDGADCKI